MKIGLKGDIREYSSEMKVIDIAKDISEGFARKVVGGIIDGEFKDLRYVVKEDCDLELVTIDTEEGKAVMWHTSAHILAQAVKRLYPTATLAIGPTIEYGFYYDIDYPLTDDDLEKIEEEMKKIVKEGYEITRFELPRQEALEYVKKQKEPYKEELINDLPDDSIISFYTQGEFTDLCRGPHLPSTKGIKAIKLLKVAGAYWRGDEKNKMLTRVYGITFMKQKELTEYLDFIKEAKERDHRKLGRELEIFTIYDEGPGFPVYLNNGMIIKEELIKYWRKLHKRAGYLEIQTPTILSRKLWETSGHWYHYKENMYTTKIDEHDFAIKPMNCPGGILAYKQKLVSYRDLPLRVGELGHVHRHELSGALHGLMRVRAFTQDDAHIYMLEEQIKDEIKNVLKLADTVYNKFGFKYEVLLSTRPDDFLGDIETWNFAEKSLKEALEENGLEFTINEGDGAFYGPKIDLVLKDSLNRKWQCGTIQLDFQLPQRFELEYISSTGKKERPIMLHRVLYGSLDRFLGILIEHFKGAFPLWISPVQVKILTINEEINEYAKEVYNKLLDEDIRVDIDLRNERIGYKIREATAMKIPYVLILGHNEKEDETLSIRPRGEVKNIVKNLDEFIKDLKEEIKNS